MWGKEKIGVGAGGGMPGGGKEIIQENIADSILKHL